MRVLYLLNVSNSSQLAADSGFTFADLLAPALTDAGAEVTVASPVPVGDPRVHFALTTSPSTKYRARFEPGMDALVALFRERRPEVVVANQVEAAPAIRAALLEAGVDALVAGYCHYLPFSFTDADDGNLELDPAMDDGGLGRSVLLAFAAGLAACDRVLVHSSTAASWTTAAAARSGVDLGDKLHIVPAPRDVRLVRDPADITPPEGRATGIYNHRLYAHYGTARFTGLARRLVADAPVRLTVMDLFGTRSPERVRLDPSPERHLEELATTDGVAIASDRGDRVRYRDLLAGAHFGIAPFRPGCPWSMSVIDCQAMGLPVIGPRTGWLAEHIDTELLFDTDEQAVRIATRLATDPEFYLLHAKRAHASTTDLAPATVAARYLEAIR
ncbi:glycosyltransferase family 1 protein [Streptomyces laurentii]|uniref:glycosyltransferase family 1 protein n=1 Tax=Streptomyces laurentii TaxID=39478 RepID=UPI0033EB6CCA